MVEKSGGTGERRPPSFPEGSSDRENGLPSANRRGNGGSVILPLSRVPEDAGRKALPPCALCDWTGKVTLPPPLSPRPEGGRLSRLPVRHRPKGRWRSLLPFEHRLEEGRCSRFQERQERGEGRAPALDCFVGKTTGLRGRFAGDLRSFGICRGLCLFLFLPPPEGLDAEFDQLLAPVAEAELETGSQGGRGLTPLFQDHIHPASRFLLPGGVEGLLLGELPELGEEGLELLMQNLQLRRVAGRFLGDGMGELVPVADG